MRKAFWRMISSARLKPSSRTHAGLQKVQIPAASITVEDSEWLKRMAAAGETVTVSLHMEARLEGEADSANVILFIDELHTVVGAGRAEGGSDAANLLKPALARGELRCIGATTLNEYKKYIEKDAALERRFQQVYVGEPSVEETISILRGLKEKYEVHHGVKINIHASGSAALGSLVNLVYAKIITMSQLEPASCS